MPMATWKDGAAYAPIERPYGFASPQVDPLSVAAPKATITPGAIPPPVGYQPMPDQLPLTAVGANIAPSRHPQTPFEVHSALMMASPAYLPRNPHMPFAVASSHIEPAATPAWATMPPPNAADRLPYGPTPPPELTPVQRNLMVIAGVAFLLGAIFPVASPILFATGGGLLLRTNHLGRQLGIGALLVAGLTGFAVLMGAQALVLDLNRWLGLLFGVATIATGMAHRR